MAVIHLIAWDNKSGVALDARLVRRVLESAGHEVVSDPIHLPRRRDRIWVRAAGLGLPRYDLNLFLENVEPAWFGHGRRNAVIPNPEWWGHPPALLRRMDRVLCKTRSAVAWFSWHQARCRWIGFASEDRLEPTMPRPLGAGQPLHVAGASNQKGTIELVDAWTAHPDWPTLTLVAHFRPGHPVFDWNRTNVCHINQRLEDAELKRLQNSAGLHLCPSDVEGYGHTIAEAMSCAAVVVTNDSPPMNELVTESRGLLARVAGVEPMRLGYRARIDREALAATIERALRLDANQARGLGTAARDWFVRNDAEFPPRLLGAVEELVN